MNSKAAKKLRRLNEKLIKINLQDFMLQASNEKFWNRIKIIFTILFKKYHISNYIKNKISRLKRKKEKND